jgi:hypothetical protein
LAGALCTFVLLSSGATPALYYLLLRLRGLGKIRSETGNQTILFFGDKTSRASQKQIFNRPHFVCQTRCHCWCLFVSVVRPHEVVMGHKQIDGMNQVFKLPGITGREPCESAIEQQD